MILVGKTIFCFHVNTSYHKNDMMQFFFLQLINDIGLEITGSISFILLLKLRLGKVFN